jgi:hypothetical protein
MGTLSKPCITNPWTEVVSPARDMRPADSILLAVTMSTFVVWPGKLRSSAGDTDLLTLQQTCPRIKIGFR